MARTDKDRKGSSGTEGVGFKTAMKVPDKGRLNIAAASTGAAKRILSNALRYARRRDEGRDVSTEAACAKMFASEMCGRAADRAVQIFWRGRLPGRVRHRAFLPRRAPVPHL